MTEVGLSFVLLKQSFTSLFSAISVWEDKQVLHVRVCDDSICRKKSKEKKKAYNMIMHFPTPHINFWGSAHVLINFMFLFLSPRATVMPV